LIVGLVSTYREGRMALSAVRSLLACCDAVHVIDAPIVGPRAGPQTDWSELRRVQSVHVRMTAKPYADDASKRTALLETTRRYPAPVWAVVLDGDEILRHGEYLPDLIEHAEAKGEAIGSPTWTFPIRLTEVDGSVSRMAGRVFRADFIERYLISSYYMLTRSGAEIALPNEPLRLAGEPDLPPVEGEPAERQRRRPLDGEPHVFHRSWLRAPQRDVQRQNVAEAGAFERLAAASGAQGERPSEGGIPLWLPNR
jgi:hypothetical protein